MSKAHSTPLTQPLVRELLDYCPDTGVLTWKPRTEANGGPKFRNWNSKWAGKTAGKVFSTPPSHHLKYIRVRVFNKDYRAHRIIWLWMTGWFPELEIDHINGNGLNNMWDNLREVTAADNRRNSRLYSSNVSGVCGVRWDARNTRWTASFNRLGRYVWLGSSKDFFEAVCLRKAADIKHEFHVNHGKVRATPSTLPPSMMQL